MAPPFKNKESLQDSDAGQTEKKTLVILAKPPDKDSKTHKSYKGNQAGNTLSGPSPQNELLKSPTVIQKSSIHSEHDASVSSSSMQQSIASSSTKDLDTFSELVKNVAQRVYHVQQKPSSVQMSEGKKHMKPQEYFTLIEQKSFPPEMTCPVKLIDESLQWCDNALEFLHDATEFYVIGVLGLQGSGKSTVMSIINGDYGERSKRQLFKTQTNDLKEIGEHCTTGIDMYVTNERLILLDTQPVMSASVMDHMIQYEKKPLGSPDYHSAENALLMQSLQQAAFLMAVCHTIVTVQDWFIDLNYLRFLLSAEMLKPTTPISVGLHDLNPMPEETSEYYPHIVFVQNKCQREDFYPSSIAKMQETLYIPLQKSKLKSSGSVHCGIQPQIPREGSKRINLFLLPDRDSSENNSSEDQFPEYKGHPGYQSLAESLCHQISSMPRSLLTHTALSEKNWFHYSARIWETVKKSNLFLEYNRLLP